MPDFATPGAIISRAFDRVARNIHVPGIWARMKLRTQLYAAFHDAHRTGDPRRERADIIGVLAGRDWQWPMFDDAVTLFRAERIWPSSWKELDIAEGVTWEQVTDYARIELLVATLTTACYVERDREQFMQMVRDRSLPRGWKQELRASHEDCPVERWFLQRHGAAVQQKAEGVKLPPFFPNDGLHLRLHTPKRR